LHERPAVNEKRGGDAFLGESQRGAPLGQEIGKNEKKMVVRG